MLYVTLVRDTKSSTMGKFFKCLKTKKKEDMKNKAAVFCGKEAKLAAIDLGILFLLFHEMPSRSHSSKCSKWQAFNQIKAAVFMFTQLCRRLRCRLFSFPTAPILAIMQITVCFRVHEITVIIHHLHQIHQNFDCV